MTDHSSPRFVHLHVHTQYSLLDGAIRIDSLMKRTREYGMSAVALTDHGTMFGAVDFYSQALKADIKPIIGCECYLAPRSLRDKTPLDKKGTAHLVLLATNQVGYRNLCKLASLAQLEGFYYKPRIDKALLQEHSQGLIGLSACLNGEVARKIQEGRLPQADEAALWYQKVLGEGNFFLEVQNNGIAEQELVNEQLREMSQRLSIPLVATNDCHYLDQDDVRAHDVLLCIQTGRTVNETNRMKFGTDQLYYKSPQEMHDYFKDYPGALDHTVAIADRCEIEFDFKTYHFPQFSNDDAKGIDALFEKEVRSGFERIMQRVRDKDPDVDERVYQQRLEYELGVIIKMGFAGYFLIVADFIRYAKENGVPVGPGRGSAAGSIVAYAMGITDLDPIVNGLIFERFLNPDRISMPDIDVDFCINGREKVFKYVVDRYGGGDYVAQIITFGSLKTRAVIRDVGRALDISLADVDKIAKLVPEGPKVNLEKALTEEPRLSEMARQRPDVDELISICRVLEGLPRHASTHAAGVVIGKKPLQHYLPLYRGKKGEVATQYDMTWVEKIGLVKFDFLGLRNLTVIDKALQLIAEQGKKAPDVDDLDFTDAATYRLLAAGDTTGVFQLESSGMKELMIKLRPECFDDIVALVALYRPGPLNSGMAAEFVERKHGRKQVTYLLPQLEPILKETYGVIVYQEQVMKIAGELANYTMADADGLRKAMGKKIAALMAEHRVRFLEGAHENGIAKEKAEEIFGLMEKFAEYGFNKSHSAAYALISFQTAFLKAHFPVEFMASLLTSEMHGIDGVVKYIEECRKHHIAVLAPDVNAGEKEFSAQGENIVFGLVAVKNVGEGAVEAIIEARSEGRFTSLFDFCSRVDLRRVNKRVVENLILCGAFDSTGAHRSQMLAMLEEAIDYGQRVQKERCNPQMGLFDAGECRGESLNPPTMPEITEFEQQKLLTMEKEALGFYMSGHPLSRYAALLEKFTSVDTQSIGQAADRQAVRVGGLVKSVRNLRTKKGDLMAFMVLEDIRGSVEVVVFPEAFAQAQALLAVDTAILVQGSCQTEENAVKIIADRIIALESAEAVWSASVHIHLDATRTSKEVLQQLKQTLSRHGGNCPGFLHVHSPNGVETVISLPPASALKVRSQLRQEVEGLLGYPAFETRCSRIEASENGNGKPYRRRRP